MSLKGAAKNRLSTAAKHPEGLEHTPQDLARQEKQAPPELIEGIRIRQLVILSFWAVVVLLGLPAWWWTTSIHRARLPLEEMADWAKGRACRPTFPLQVILEAQSLQRSEILRLVHATQHTLDDQNDFSLHHLRLRVGEHYLPANHSQQQRPQEDDSLASTLPELPDEGAEKALTVRLTPQESLTAAHAELESHSTILNIVYPPGLIPQASSNNPPLATFIASKLQDLYAEERAIIANVLMAGSSPTLVQQESVNIAQSAAASTPPAANFREDKSVHSQAPTPELVSRLASRSTRAMKRAPTYHISISLFSPNPWPTSWDIESAIEEYLAPLLDSASVISNFTVDTQTQVYASLSPSVQQPQYDPDRGVWTLRQEDLSGFVNAAEWPLSPSIGPGPTLNFIIYVPDAATTPLVIQNSHATSWSVPQWGGVAILNPQTSAHSSGNQPSTLSKEDLQPALLIFSHQLLSFLGAPQSPSSIPMQLQTLTRLRAASLLLSASSTMGSLANLTVALPSIAIPESVSTVVDFTLDHLHKTCDALKDGRFGAALETAKKAETAAEQGFFEKSMVGQVYFPDEHKVAVYLPLLGPVGVPLIMSGLKELRRVWTTRASGTAS
ncbi:MAG: hypothetical protein Q9174_001700 [Haloplaca sp. 1 TL-2023]